MNEEDDQRCAHNDIFRYIVAMGLIRLPVE